eukprot:COSAG06_NODE_483_length_15127_cov_38.842960_3_plen_166_part_00
MLGGLITYGVRRFFKDSWNVMDTIVVGSGWLDLAGLKTGVGMLRMIRVFRPLRTLTKVESMRLVVQALVSSIPGLANVLLLAAFMVFIFALFGLKLWIGVLSGRCFSPSPQVTAALLTGENAPGDSSADRHSGKGSTGSSCPRCERQHRCHWISHVARLTPLLLL